MQLHHYMSILCAQRIKHMTVPFIINTYNAQWLMNWYISVTYPSIPGKATHGFATDALF
jgi:hypothetical protein